MVCQCFCCSSTLGGWVHASCSGKSKRSEVHKGLEQKKRDKEAVNQGPREMGKPLVILYPVSNATNTTAPSVTSSSCSSYWLTALTLWTPKHTHWSEKQAICSLNGKITPFIKPRSCKTRTIQQILMIIELLMSNFLSHLSLKSGYFINVVLFYRCHFKILPKINRLQ